MPVSAPLPTGPYTAGVGTPGPDVSKIVAFLTQKGSALDSELRPDVYNVRSYGAIGNGVADDATAILAAVAAADAANGGIVYFPAGLYLCSARINLAYTALITFRGHNSRLDRHDNIPLGTVPQTGDPNVELRFTGTGAEPFINISQSYGTRFEGLAVRYSSSLFTGALVSSIYDPVGALAGYGLIVRDCLFGSSSGSIRTAYACLVLNGIIEADIENSTMSRCQYGAVGMISVNGYSDNINFKGCRFVDHASAAVLNPKNRWLFIGTTFENDNAVKATTVGGRILGLSFVSCGFWDHVGGTWIDLDAEVHSLLITGCRTEVRNGTAPRFLRLSNSLGLTMTGNWFEGFGTNAKLWNTTTTTLAVESRIDNNVYDLTFINNTNDLTAAEIGFAAMQAPSAPPVRVVTASTTLDVRRCGGLILADATTAPLTVTLHDYNALMRGQEVTVKKTDASVNAVTIAPASGQNIDGFANFTTTEAKATVTLAAHTTGWQVVARSGAVTGTAAAVATAPGQVTGLTATPGDTTVSLSWVAPTNGGSAITDYRIEQQIGAAAFTVVVDGVGTGTSYIVPSLTNGTAYIYRVSAINAIGTGLPSATTTATPVAPAAATAPGQVTGLTATPASGQVALSWTAPATGGSAITDYVVQFRTGAAAFAAFADGVSTGTTATVTGLTNGTAYDFRVAAVNAVGTGVFSATAASTPAVPAGYTIGGITGWAAAYDASNLLGTGTNPVDGVLVSQWADLSGNSKHATQADAVAQPTFFSTGTNLIGTQPVVRFFGGTDELVSATPLVTPTYTLFVVYRPQDAPAGDCLYSMRSTVSGTPILAQTILPTSPAGSLTVQTRNDAATLQQAAGTAIGVTGESHTVTVSAAAGGITVFRNGISHATGTNVTVPVTVTNGYIGNALQGNPFRGGVGMVLVHPTVLSTVDQQAVEAALRAKYGTP